MMKIVLAIRSNSYVWRKTLTSDAYPPFVRIWGSLIELCPLSSSLHFPSLPHPFTSSISNYQIMFTFFPSANTQQLLEFNDVKDKGELNFASNISATNLSALEWQQSFDEKSNTIFWSVRANTSDGIKFLPGGTLNLTVSTLISS